jgi:hypothetical protein
LQRINNKILGSDLIGFVVHNAVAETYLQHAADLPNKNDLLRMVGQLKLLFYNAGLLWSDRPGEEVPEEDIRAREGRLNTIRYLLQNLDLNVLENAALSCDDDVFMETLVNNVRNETCSYQAFYISETKKRFLDGAKKLKTLKSNYTDNADEIKQLEKKLNDITDRQLRAELENYSVYEHLVSEKMNPKFLCLAKSYNQQKGLDSIMDSNGDAFASDTLRKEFITNYYANIYKEVPGRVNSYPGCVADFLGEEITNNPEVAGKKYRKI